MVNNQVLERCTKRLKEYLAGARVVVARREGGVEVVLGTRRLVGLLRNQGPTGEQVRHLAIEAKARHPGRRLLLLAPWIRENGAQRLREAGLCYIDAAGNAHLELDAPRILVDVRGRRPDRVPKAEPGRLIEPTGLKVIHLLLTRKDAIRQTYRKIAAAAGVALGTVGVVLRELRTAGFVAAEGPDRWRLDRTADLVEHFVRGYALKLRPACLVGRYRHAEPDPMKRCETLTRALEARRIPHALTGVRAAYEWNAHLRDETVALFAGDGAAEAWAAEPMLPDPERGNVVVLRHFGPAVDDPDGGSGPRLATKLLVYAELLHDGRPRELETAGMIFDRLLGTPAR